MDNELDNASEMPADLPWQFLEEITNGFSEERKIGSGGYGVVYKGVYKNGEEIAVKKLYHMPGLDDKQFQNELQSLTRLCHRNIVRLVGKSYEEKERFGEYEGKLVCAKMIDRVICLEYLHNGSLEKHLSDESSGLPWHMRYKIVKGICDGLAYLHGCRIFHLDLKPANVLLDKNMVPKIADFGLSRLFSGTRQSHTTSKFLGTIGYVPPEYIERGKISEKFDVFSLGVIIIGIMTGPDGYSKQSDMSSQDFIEQVLKNWRNRLLEQWKDKSYFNVFCEQVKLCIEIALNCVETDRHKRPSIGDIICKLTEFETYKPLMSLSLPIGFCLSISGDSSRAGTPRPDTSESSVSVGARRSRDDNVPRKRTVTSTPHFDGYQWRKYGQKRLMNTNFPRCYYKCSYHRERNCPATKQVQQHSNGDPPLYHVIYQHDHTCHTSASEPEPANGATNPLVSSLAYALQGQYSGRGGVGVPESSLDRTGDASASASSVDARLDVDEGLDVMDYDVTDTKCFDTSYGLRDDGRGGSI